MPGRPRPLALAGWLAATMVVTAALAWGLNAAVLRYAWREEVAIPFVILAATAVFMIGVAFAWIEAGYQVDWPEGWPRPRWLGGGNRRVALLSAAAMALAALLLAGQYALLPALFDLVWEWLKRRFGG